MIREATMDDLEALATFCLECQDAMHWQAHGLSGDARSVVATLADLIRSPHANVSVVDLGGEVSGVCAVVVAPFAWNYALLVASEWIWHMRPSMAGGLARGRWFVQMLDHMTEWAKDNGASVFRASAVPGSPAEKLLERRGVRVMETACVGGL